eukprot:2090216-Prymnesium_polylepis.1
MHDEKTSALTDPRERPATSDGINAIARRAWPRVIAGARRSGRVTQRKGPGIAPRHKSSA